VSAANYHFGSKEALLQAALVRRIAPLNASRLKALEAAEAAAGGGPASVEAIVEAFLRPGFEARRDVGGGRPAFRTLAARLYADPHEMVASLKLELFGPVFERFDEAFARALPDRPRDELRLDLQFLVGVMVHVIDSHPRTAAEDGEPEAIPDDRVLERMVAFAAAGLRAGTASLRGPVRCGEIR